MWGRAGRWLRSFESLGNGIGLEIEVENPNLAESEGGFHLSGGQGGGFPPSGSPEGSWDVLVLDGAGVHEAMELLGRPDARFRENGKRLCAVSQHVLPGMNRPVFLTDPLLDLSPDVTSRVETGSLAARLAARAGIGRPRVAVLAAIEKVDPSLKRSVEAAEVAARVAARGGMEAQGPLSLDVALIESAARIKGVAGEVAGKADVLVAPDLATASGLYSVFTHIAKAPSAMVVTGGKLPIAVASKLDSENTVRNSLLLALVAVAREAADS